MDGKACQTPEANDRGALKQSRPERPLPVRVLIVEDELPASKLLSTILAQNDCQCVTANNGSEAFGALEHGKFDAIISDLRMPGMDGLELLAAIRRRQPHIAFLVTTGVDDLEMGLRAMKSGADDYLVKPLLEETVIASLERALHRQSLDLQIENYRLRLEEMVAERTAQLQKALQQIERSYEDTLQALGAAIDLRDTETAGHCRRVCGYSLEIARAMGLADKQLDKIARGAYLHDIGKLGIPDSVLLKPGPLTAQERTLMQKHPQIGFDLVKDIPFLAGAAEIVLAHHERYDGRGYPHNLKGNEIPLGARIFAVVDALDAITSDRPYRSASSFGTAISIIKHESGHQFDPGIIEVFLSIPTDSWQAMAKHHREMAAAVAESSRNVSTLPTNANNKT